MPQTVPAVSEVRSDVAREIVPEDFVDFVHNVFVGFRHEEHGVVENDVGRFDAQCANVAQLCADLFYYVLVQVKWFTRVLFRVEHSTEARA